MQQFQIITGPPNGQRNYVFVDEHNRHKRLKVMRACEGCRRRKIKCDSATTNTWPCSACTRLKLHCVPPTTGNEGDPYGVTLYPENEDVPSQDHMCFTEAGELDKHLPNAQSSTATNVHINIHNTYRPSTHNLVTAPAQPVGQFPRVENHASIAAYGYNSDPTRTRQYNGDVPAQRFAHNEYPSLHRSETDSSTTTETAEDLSEQLGDLKIGENGIALYARQQGKNEPEPEAPLHDSEDSLPPLRTIAGSQIRIPPALMPSDEEALGYFQIYFRDIHPYLPVLNRRSFYQQWHTDRSAISPLLLEAVFACACRLADQPAGGSQWVSLANRE